MSKPLALLIDDEPDILELLELTLGRMQVDARKAKTQSEALALLKAEHFSI